MAQIQSSILRIVMSGHSGKDLLVRNSIIKRSSYVRVTHNHRRENDAKCAHKQYSTQTANAAAKAYHKQDLTGFVYHLSVEEREELLQTLSRVSTATQKPAEVPMPTKSELRYGKSCN